MEELCEMLTHKLQLIAKKIDYKCMSKSAKDELLDTLMVEKKKQSLRVLVQTRLQQAMATRHMSCEEEINQVRTKSFEIMKIYKPELLLPQAENSLAGLAKLFVEFFAAVSCSHRSQEIKTLYEKRLCPKPLVAATLFNWLVEWTRKQFQEYLKVNIHSLYVNSRQSASLHSQKQVQKAQNQDRTVDSLNKIGLFLEHFPSKLMIHKRQVKKKEHQQNQLPKSLQRLRIMSQNNLRPYNRENTTQDENVPINKQVFLYAFAQELQILYRSIEDCLPDLESGWARRLKRGGRRQEALRRVNVVAHSCIRQMPEIKQSIDDYREFYQKNFIQKQRLKQKQAIRNKKQVQSLKSSIEKKKKKKKKRESLNEEQYKETVQNQKEDQKLLQNVDQSRKVSNTQQLFNDKNRKNLCTVSRNYRYSLDTQENSQSNLLMTAQKQSRVHKKSQVSLEISYKTLDLTLDRNKQQSTYLLINQRGYSNQLQIIQERVKKMRVLHGRPTKHSISQNKDKAIQDHNKSIEIDKSLGRAFRSVEGSLNKDEKMYVKLPKVKVLK